MFGSGAAELGSIVVLSFCLIPGIVGAIWAGCRGRNSFGWFVIGVISPPRGDPGIIFP
jgi:hypothetical protein